MTESPQFTHTSTSVSFPKPLEVDEARFDKTHIFYKKGDKYFKIRIKPEEISKEEYKKYG